MSLKGTTILYTDLVFNFQKISLVVVDDYGGKAIVIEAVACEPSYDRHVGEQLDDLDWTLDEWEKYGWEIIPPTIS